MKCRALASSICAMALAFALPLAAAGRASLQAFFQKTLKDPAYQKVVYDRVAKSWKSPAATAFPKIGAKAVVQVVIARDGQLVSTELTTGSGSKEWDTAAEAAARDAAPFPKLPAGFPDATLQVHFHVMVVK